MIAQCTCKPSGPAVMCPIEEHRTRAAMEGLRVVGARSGSFGTKVVGRDLTTGARVEWDIGEPEDSCE